MVTFTLTNLEITKTTNVNDAASAIIANAGFTIDLENIGTPKMKILRILKLAAIKPIASGENTLQSWS